MYTDKYKLKYSLYKKLLGSSTESFDNTIIVESCLGYHFEKRTALSRVRRSAFCVRCMCGRSPSADHVTLEVRAEEKK